MRRLKLPRKDSWSWILPVAADTAIRAAPPCQLRIANHLSRCSRLHALFAQHPAKGLSYVRTILCE